MIVFYSIYNFTSPMFIMQLSFIYAIILTVFAYFWAQIQLSKRKIASSILINSMKMKVLLYN